MAAARPPHARKRPRDAPTHVASWPLRPTPRDRGVVERRFEGGRRVQNACLGESVRRAAAVRADPALAAARAMPRGEPRSPAAVARATAFRAVNAAHGFTETALLTFGSGLRQAWVRDQVPAQEAQVLARRAFQAVQRYQYGLGGPPRFKPFPRGLRSLEAKDGNGALRVAVRDGVPVGLQWTHGFVIRFAPVRTRAEHVEWARIADHVGAGRVRHARIVRTLVGTKVTYRAQLVLDAPAPVRHPVGTEMVSLDLGPSTVDVVSDSQAFTVPLAEGVTTQTARLRRLQRRLDRQHRAGSPACFDARGRHGTGRCQWTARSKNAARTQRQLADAHRRRAAHVATAHGRLLNRLLALGPHLRAEALSYVAWQKTFPRSVRDHAPGAFIAAARRKAAGAGGGLYAYSPWTTALSQMCVCGRRVKKPLRQQVHRCVCGVTAPRNRFSAFLGRSVHRTVDARDHTIDTLDVAAAAAAHATRHDIAGVPTSRPADGPANQRVHRHRPAGRRSVVRQAARWKHHASARADRAGRAHPVHPTPTAVAA